MILRDIPSLFLSALAALTVATTAAMAASPSCEELAAGEQWAMAHLGSCKAALPFSFVYDGKSSSELLAQWKFQSGSRELDKARTERTLTWSDPKSRLTLRCVAVEYDDFPRIEPT
jgi:hypothetical protein